MAQPTLAEQIESTHEAFEYGRRPATPAQARRILSL